MDLYRSDLRAFVVICAVNFAQDMNRGVDKMEKRLYKSSKNKMLDGVCAGIAEYFGIDPTLVRIALVLFCAMGGAGILAYIVMAIVMPRNPEQ